MSTRRLEQELIARGLVPPSCKLLEVRIEPSHALVVRYEILVKPEQMDQFADALKAAAQAALADEERMKQAQRGTHDNVSKDFAARLRGADGTNGPSGSTA